VTQSKLRQRIAGIVSTYDESLAAAGVERLSQDQREVLQAVLAILYQRRAEHDGRQAVSKPRLVG